ncbi:MAG: hypothetical protein V4671_25295 [Armatimonadota bacterium]
MTEIITAGARVPESPRRVVIVFAALLLFLLFPKTAAHAEWIPRVAVLPPAKGTVGAVTVNERVIARLRLPAESIPAAGRLRQAAALIDQQLRLFPGKVTVEAARRTPGKDSAVWLNGTPVLIATEADAKEQGGSTLSLAQRWASQLRSAASLPALRFPLRQIIVPVGESRTLELKGIARGPLQLSSSTGNAFSAVVGEPAPSGGTTQIRLIGRNPGNEQLVVERDGATAAVEVIVQPWAGFISTPAPVVLTGASVDAATRWDLAVASVKKSVRLTPGAALKLTGESPYGSARESKMVPISSGTETVPVEISGPNMLTRRSDVPVRISSSVPPVALPATTLLYSNDPEGITRPQVLFTARLGERSKGATRLLYHHQSRLSTDALFLVDLINDSETSARLHLRGATAGPVIDTVWVGYRAGDAFLQALSDGSGYYLDIPARSRIRTEAIRLPAGQTVSGIQEMVQTAGQPVQVRIAAVAESDEEKNYALFTPAPSAGTVAGQVTAATPSAQPPPSDARFADPHLTLRNEYRVGGRWDFVTIGHGNTNPSATSATSAANLIGAYGYLYDIEWNLINPTDKAASVRISFTPTAGLASGVFWIDGQTIERVPQAREQQEIQILRVQLMPGEQRRVKLRTMPLAGSNYPARLVVHP